MHYCRDTLKTLYNNREAILEEPLSKNTFRNKGLCLRKKLGRQRKIFEDRLASVILNFSTKIDVSAKLAIDIAKVWISLKRL